MREGVMYMARQNHIDASCTASLEADPASAAVNAAASAERARILAQLERRKREEADGKQREAREAKEREAREAAVAEMKRARTEAAAARIALEAKDAELRVAKAKLLDVASLVRQVAARAVRSEPLTGKEMHQVALAVQAAHPDMLAAALSAAAQQAIARQLQRQALVDVPYIPLGQVLQPSAYRSEVHDLLRGAPLEIRVIDNGAGFNPAMQTKLLQPFSACTIRGSFRAWVWAWRWRARVWSGWWSSRRQRPIGGYSMSRPAAVMSPTSPMSAARRCVGCVM